MKATCWRWRRGKGDGIREEKKIRTKYDIYEYSMRKCIALCANIKKLKIHFQTNKTLN